MKKRNGGFPGVAVKADKGHIPYFYVEGPLLQFGSVKKGFVDKQSKLKYTKVIGQTECKGISYYNWLFLRLLGRSFAHYRRYCHRYQENPQN